MVGLHSNAHSAFWLLLGESSPAKQRQTSVPSSHATLLRSSRTLNLRLSRQTSLMTSASIEISPELQHGNAVRRCAQRRGAKSQ